jgi:putative N6-adenine-specific DNA methylase
MPVSFRVTARQSRLIHGKRVAETLQSAVERALGTQPAPVGDLAQLVLVRILDDEVTISIDSTGELLHRRGYRQAVTPAPLRETLAAGCLLLLGWDGSQPLVDPMCGTGSFLTEALLLATQRAPGAERRFAFMNWPGYRDGLWQLLTGAAHHGVKPLETRLSGADRDIEAITAAEKNLERAGCAGLVDFTHRPLVEQAPHAGPGLVISNPPYGLRLITEEPIEEFYACLGRDLQSAYPDWQKSLLCPDPELVKATGLPFELVTQLDNGGLQVGLYRTKPG